MKTNTASRPSIFSLLRRLRLHRVHHAALGFLLLALAPALHAQQYSWSTLAGAGGVSGSADSPGVFNQPYHLARDSSGSVYVSDYASKTIRKVTPGGVVSTFAGTAGQSGSTDATGAAARFVGPGGIVVDASGNVFVSDFDNHTIRMITPAAVVSTLAGSPGAFGSADGVGAAARFGYPQGLALDGLGNLYVADRFNNTIRKIVISTATVSTLAGQALSAGSADGTGVAARFNQPFGLVMDGSGNLVVTDGANHTLRRVTPAGVVTTLAGLAGTSGSTDGTGSAARLNLPYDLVLDGTSNTIFFTEPSSHTVRRVTADGAVSTLCGLAGVTGYANGTGSNARFDQPAGIVLDGTSNTLLISEVNNQDIRRVSLGGACSTWLGTPGVAGAADSVGTFSGPTGMARDSSGNFFVPDYDFHVIRKITPAGVLSTFAGQSGTSGSTDATGGAARFNGPWGIAIDGTNNLYVAEAGNHTIRKITPAGVVTTLAGLALTAGTTDGTGNVARFNIPAELKVDSSGTNLFVAERDNHTIRKVVIATGAVTTFAGLAGASGSANGTGNAARFNGPTGIAVDASGNVFVGNSDNHTLRKITPAGVVTTLAGLAGTIGSTDGTGSAARFNYPYGLVFDGAGNLLVADRGNNTLRKVTPAGVVTTLAGLAGVSGDTDGVGSAARLNDPFGLALDGFGNIYVACYNPGTIRKVTPGGAVTAFAGAPGLFATTNTGGNFNLPNGTAVDAAGNVYVADTFNHTIRKITPGGVISTLAGQAGVSGSADGTGTAARLSAPRDVAVDTAGNSYVTDSFNQTIRRVTAAGVVSTLAGQPGVSGTADGTGSLARFSVPWGLCVDAAGVNLYVADSFNNTIRQVVIATGAVTTLAGQAGVPGAVDATGTAARFSNPQDTAVDAAGNVYVADTNNRTVRKIAPGGVVTTLAGQAGSSGTVDGTGAAARFGFPVNVAVDAAGILYVADSFNHTIRRVNTTTAAVTTIGGLAGSSGSVDGTGSTARFNQPLGMALDAAGNLYVSEVGHTIRKGTRVGSRARLVQPAFGAALPAPTTVFQWEAGLGATKYVLYVGSTPGGYNLYAGDEGTNLSRTVALPPDIKVYVTLYSLIGGTYQSNSYAFEPAPSAKAAIISPAQGSTLASAMLNLQWSAATGASGYAIWLGSSLGGYDLGAAGYGAATNTASFTVPADGGLVYVRLYSLINGAYVSNDHWFLTQTGAGNRCARLTNPTPIGSKLPAGGNTFTWDAGVGATNHVLWVGSTPYGYDIYAAALGAGTIAFLNNLPADGRTLYVTLYSQVGGTYLSNSYHFMADGVPGANVGAVITTANAVGASLNLGWSVSVFPQNYALWVGSTPGSYDIYAGSEGVVSGKVVPVPTDGRELHITLYTLFNGAYHATTATATATNSGVTQRAMITSHVNGAALPSAGTTFTWNAGVGTSGKVLWVGSTPGGYDLYAAVEAGTSRALTLPTDGRKVYLTLYSVISGAYVPNSYVFTAPKIATTKAVLASPANGSTLTGSSAVFNWIAGTGATKYILYIGSTPGGYDRYVGDEGTGLARTVNGLPTDGRPLHVTLYSLINGAYQGSSYVFNAWQSP